jgi:hypothetical protein
MNLHCCGNHKSLIVQELRAETEEEQTEPLYGRLVTGNTDWHKSPTAENIFRL